MTTDELAALVADLRAFTADHQHVEAKTSRATLPKKLWQTLSAFANSPGGGVLLLGFSEEEGFAATGVSDIKKVTQDLASLCDTMEPPIRALVNPVEFEGASVVVAEIPEAPVDKKPCYYPGAGLTNGVFVRVADGDRRLSQYEVHVMLASRGQPAEDREPVRGTSLADLNPDLTALFLERLRAARAAFHTKSDEQILRTVNVTTDADGVQVLTLAGLLSLGAEPERFFPELSLTFVAYPGTRIGEPGPRGERFTDEARVEGPIPLMIEPVLILLHRNMKKRAVVHGLGRETQWEYPITALREAIVNALVHRDLGSMARGTPVQVQLFPDRLAVVNPGGLHGPVTIESLGEAGVSSSRNASLMRILEDTVVPGEKYLVCENRGSGIGAMLIALRGAGMSPPEFKNDVATFKVTFPNHTLFDQGTLEWLASIGADSLSDNQRVGLALLRTGQELSNEIYRRFNNIDSRLATRELREMVQLRHIRSVSTGRWTTYALAGAEESQPLLPIFDSPAERPTVGTAAGAVLQLLRSAGEMSRGELAEQLGSPASTTRYWLRKLLDADLVERTTRSPNDPATKYRAKPTR